PTQTTAISPLSLHDAFRSQPVMRDHRLVGSDEALARSEALACKCQSRTVGAADQLDDNIGVRMFRQFGGIVDPLEPPDIDPTVRSEEHTSELQSRENLVCR